MSHPVLANSLRKRSTRVLSLMLLGAFASPTLFGQTLAPSSGMQRSPRDWAVLASRNEEQAIDHAGSALRYRVHTVDAKGDRLREVVECSGGSVSRLLAIDGKPLTVDQEATERKRLQDLAQDPDNFAHHSEEDAKGRKLARDLIRLMPDAMVYTPVPSEDGRAADGSPTLAFDFAPNPQWHPPTTISEALTGLRGRVWVNTRSGYVERLQGEVFRSINFGYGMVAHIFPGGRVELQQTDVGDGRWLYKHFAQNLRIRALMLKTIQINTKIDTSDYQTVPATLTYQQAIALLFK